MVSISHFHAQFPVEKARVLFHLVKASYERDIVSITDII